MLAALVLFMLFEQNSAIESSTDIDNIKNMYKIYLWNLSGMSRRTKQTFKSTGFLFMRPKMHSSMINVLYGRMKNIRNQKKGSFASEKSTE